MLLMLPLTPLVCLYGWRAGSSFTGPEASATLAAITMVTATATAHTFLICLSPFRVRANGRAPMLRRHKGKVTNVLRLVLEAVADAPYGLDARLLERASRELAAQGSHVDVHRSRLDEAVAAPDHVEQLFTTEDAAGRADQGGQELELLRRQLHLAAFHPDLEAVAINLQISDLEAGLLFLGVRRAAAPQHRADPGDQLAWRERLGDVVGGPRPATPALLPLP